jgi:hypothetical protein
MDVAATGVPLTRGGRDVTISRSMLVAVARCVATRAAVSANTPVN